MAGLLFAPRVRTHSRLNASRWGLAFSFHLVNANRALLLAAVALLAACSGRPHPVERLAILPFENLTGDASLDWVASTAPAIVAADLSGVSKVFAQPMPNRSDAYLANATRLVHGYFTGSSGALRFEVDVEDASRHKMITDETASGDVLSAMNAVAKHVDPAAHSFSTSNAEALAAWGHRDFERSVALDPDFGAAWLGWADTLAQKGETAEAIEVGKRALARSSLQSNIDRARIELILATLRRDTGARDKALSTLTGLLTTDVPLMLALAEAELNARRFSAAVEVFKNILKVDPENVGVMNSLGYAQAYAADLNAAVKTLDAYGKLPDQRTNSLDSLGEAYFMNGRFGEAEKYFLQAYDSNHGFLGGADLMKAAYAHWLAGDLKGADGLMTRYLETRRADPVNAWREAVWDYATGRRDQAIAKLKSAPETPFSERQLANWNQSIPTDLDALKQAYEHTPPSADGQARAFYAAALAAAGQKEEARKLLGLWPLPGEAGGDPLRESMVFPTFISARRAVGLQAP